MEYETVNNVKIKPVVIPKLKEDEILGYEYFPQAYPNIMICARKRSGKTTLVYNILKKCINKKTMVFIFSPTVGKDATYIKIVEMLKKRKINVNKYLHFLEPDGSNIISELVNELIKDDDMESESEGENPKIISACKFEDEKKVEKEKKEKKPSKIAPEICIIIDDLASEMRNKALANLTIKNRHMRALILLISHHPSNLLPQARTNLDYCIVFRGMPDEKLCMLHHDLNISVPLERFMEIYKEVTKEPYSFLWISCSDDELRAGFNRRIVL